MSFTDRAEAGRRLGARLAHLSGEPVVVLGLPRGGVPVAAAVADALGAALDVVVVRKLGLPRRPELAMGAVGEGGVLVLIEDVLGRAHIAGPDLDRVVEREREQVRRRARRFRGDRERTSLRGRTVVLVDDGAATGASALAACRVVRRLGVDRVVLAVPVCPSGVAARLRAEVDEFVCLESRADFLAVGRAYADFHQISDEEVAAALRRGRVVAASGGRHG